MALRDAFLTSTPYHRNGGRRQLHDKTHFIEHDHAPSPRPTARRMAPAQHVVVRRTQRRFSTVPPRGSRRASATGSASPGLVRGGLLFDEHAGPLFDTGSCIPLMWLRRSTRRRCDAAPPSAGRGALAAPAARGRAAEGRARRPEHAGTLAACSLQIAACRLQIVRSRLPVQDGAGGAGTNAQDYRTSTPAGSGRRGSRPLASTG